MASECARSSWIAASGRLTGSRIAVRILPVSSVVVVVEVFHCTASEGRHALATHASALVVVPRGETRRLLYDASAPKVHVRGTASRRRSGADPSSSRSSPLPRLVSAPLTFNVSVPPVQRIAIVIHVLSVIGGRRPSPRHPTARHSVYRARVVADGELQEAARVAGTAGHSGMIAEPGANVSHLTRWWMRVRNTTAGRSREERGDCCARDEVVTAVEDVRRVPPDRGARPPAARLRCPGRAERRWTDRPTCRARRGASQSCRDPTVRRASPTTPSLGDAPMVAGVHDGLRRCCMCSLSTPRSVATCDAESAVPPIRPCSRSFLERSVSARRRDRARVERGAHVQFGPRARWRCLRGAVQNAIEVDRERRPRRRREMDGPVDVVSVAPVTGRQSPSGAAGPV